MAHMTYIKDEPFRKSPKRFLIVRETSTVEKCGNLFIQKTPKVGETKTRKLGNRHLGTAPSGKDTSAGSESLTPRSSGPRRSNHTRGFAIVILAWRADLNCRYRFGVHDPRPRPLQAPSLPATTTANARFPRYLTSRPPPSDGTVFPCYSSPSSYPRYPKSKSSTSSFFPSQWLPTVQTAPTVLQSSTPTLQTMSSAS
jgi:hypothetical protein